MSGPGEMAGLQDLFELRGKSLHRKHGDPFPMPRLKMDALEGDDREFTSLPRRVDECLRCVNELAAASFSHTVSGDSLPWTDVQRWMFSDLVHRVSEHGAHPTDLDGPSALQELCSDESLYSQEAAHLACFDSSKVKILHRKLQPSNAEDLLPPASRFYLDHFQELIERPQHEVESLASQDDFPQPYWDPTLKRSRKKRLELYKLLWDANLLTFRKRRKARAGLFVVRKKDGVQRLIIDARQANACQNRPPLTQLSTGAGMVSLDLSPASLEAQGFSFVGEHPPQCCFESGDVSDCFYNFRVKRLASWFSFDDKFTIGELREMGYDITSLFNDDLQQEELVYDSDWVYACFGGLPMGWAWALYFANEAIVHQSTASRGFDASDVIRDRQRPPEVRPNRPALGIYVDNVHAFAGEMGQASQRIREITQRFESLGIPFVTDHVETSLMTDSLGMTLDFRDQCRVRPKSRRAWRLWFAIHEILRRPRIHGRLLQVLLGHLVHHFQLARSALSILSACYRFVADHWFHRAPIWSSVKRELRQCLGMLFVIEYNMSADTCHEVHLGDSSDLGYSLMFTHATHQEIRTALQDREKWRFIVSTEPQPLPPREGPRFVGERDPDEDDWVNRDHNNQNFHYSGCSAEPSLGACTQYGRECSAKLKKHLSKGSKKKPRFLDAEPTMIAGPPIPAISDCWSQQFRWQLICAKPWTDPSCHINEKEGRVCLMGLRRLVRSVKNLGKVAFSISDNLSCVLAFEKGRSSSSRMNALCRRAAAYQISGGIQWRLRHIRSELNVADKPSRIFSGHQGRVPLVSRHVEDGMVDTLGSHGHVPTGNDFRPEAQQIAAPSTSSSAGSTRAVPCGLSGSARARRTAATRPLHARARTRNNSDSKSNSGREEFNLLRKSTQQVILRLLASGKIKYVHFGTPCRTFSRSRHNLKNYNKARDLEAQGVAMAIFTVRCIRILLRVGCYFSVENPLTSRLWDFQPLQSIFKNKNSYFIRWDMCRFGTAYKKPTAILTNLQSLTGLSCLCRCGRRHVQLRGSESRRVNGKIVRGTKTSFAGEYPEALCERWASLVRDSLGSSTVSTEEFMNLSNDFRRALLEARRQSRRHGPQNARGPPATSDSQEDDRVYREAQLFIREQGVIFGQHTNAEAQAIRQGWIKA